MLKNRLTYSLQCITVFGFITFGMNTVHAAEKSSKNASSELTQAATEVDSIQELKRRLDPIKSMRANFTQVTSSSNPQQSAQILKGTMQVSRPGKFRWETQPPFEQLTVTDGQQLWVYDSDLEQVTLKTLDKQASQTPALILTGSLNDIRSAYEVFGAENGQGQWQFALLPKSKEALFNRLQLTFDKNNDLHSMMIDDGLGQKTDIRFANVELNPTLSSALFHFKIPKGVDVIRDPGMVKPDN